MSGFIKIRAKELLLGNTLKLFFVSGIAFILKLLATFSLIISTNAVLISPFLQNLVITYNSLPVYFIYSLIVVSLYLSLLLFISGLKMGENAIYFMHSKGSKAKFKYLFIFLKPSQSFRALYLYLKIFLLKISWFLYFYSAPVFCFFLILFLYFNTSVYSVVVFTLILGSVILLSISHFYYNAAIARYNYAVYYLCTDIKIPVKKAIDKSLQNSDGFIRDAIILKSSFFFWLISCIFILPFFYVIPFKKLTNAKFVTFTDSLYENSYLQLNSFNLKSDRIY
jgi:hypothetical protein